MPKTLGIWEWGCPKRGDAQSGKSREKRPGDEVVPVPVLRFISMLIVEFNVQIFTVECTDIYKNTKKTLTGLRYFLFIHDQLSFNGHSPRRSPGVGHVVFKIMYPDKFYPAGDTTTRDQSMVESTFASHFQFR